MLSEYYRTIPAFDQAKASQKQGLFNFPIDEGMNGGGDGGRTRVQKAIHDGIYKFSLSTEIPPHTSR